MNSSRDRVMSALNFETPDRVLLDLASMRSTGISAFAYPKLVAALGLPPRRSKVEDTGQMLALPDLDVLDALGCDVITICDGATNAFEQSGLWHDYDLNGRLPARVQRPADFKALADGTIVQGNSRMVPDSVVFDAAHGGQPLDLSADLPKPDLKEVKAYLDAHEIRDDQIVATRELCWRVRESTNRAVFLNTGAIGILIGIGGFGGLAIFPMLCLLEPDLIAELHDIITDHALRNIRALLPEIRDSVDIVMLAADDWGTQRDLIASPKVYRELFLPYHKRVTRLVKKIAPNVKRFPHSCGAIYSLIDLVIGSGFDILNPVQWCAGTPTYRDWKDKARNRIALWGGGVNSQITLPLGTVADVEAEVREVVKVMAEDGGYVFCNIHNILAEVTPDKVIAMYGVAAGLSGTR